MFMFVVCCLLFVDVYVLMFMLFCFDVYVFAFFALFAFDGPYKMSTPRMYHSINT